MGGGGGASGFNGKLKTYSLSTLAVASSINKILFLNSKALARQSNCLCPTLKFIPPSEISVLSLFGRSNMTSFNSTFELKKMRLHPHN